jgi:hypothetical protein
MQFVPGLGLAIVGPGEASSGTVAGGAEPVDGPELGGTEPAELEPTGPAVPGGTSPPDELEGLAGAIASPLEPPSTSAPPTRPPHAGANTNTVAPHSELPRRTAYPSSARDRVRTETGVFGRIGSPRQWPQSPISVRLASEGASPTTRDGRAMTPYRTPPAPPVPRVHQHQHKNRPTDLLDILFWALVVTFGLATASSGGHPSAAAHEARTAQ